MNNTIDEIDDLIYRHIGIVFVSKAEESNPMAISGFLKREANMILDLNQATGVAKEEALAKVGSLVDDFNYAGASNAAIDKLISDVTGALTVMGSVMHESTIDLTKAHMLDIAASVKEQIQFDFLMDQTAPVLQERRMVNLLAEQQNLFKGAYLTDDLAAKAGDIILKDIAEIGGDVTRIAGKLKESLGGLVNAPDHYWDTYASSSLNRSRSYASLYNFQQGGVVEAEIVNPLDERTTTFCRSVNGRIIVIEQALSHLDEIVAAKTLDEIKNISPFVQTKLDKQGEATHTITRNGEKTSFKDNVSDKFLNENGIFAPPFHHRCRSALIPIVSGDLTLFGYSLAKNMLSRLYKSFKKIKLINR